MLMDLRKYGVILIQSVALGHLRCSTTSLEKRYHCHDQMRMVTSTLMVSSFTLNLPSTRVKLKYENRIPHKRAEQKSWPSISSIPWVI